MKRPAVVETWSWTSKPKYGPEDEIRMSAARVLSAAKLSDYFRLILEREQIVGRRITKIILI